MGYVAAQKLNIFPDVTAWGSLPLAFIGALTKAENGEELKNRFVDKNGKKLKNNEAFILGIIRSQTRSFGKCTLTYEGWSDLLGKCDKTIWACLSHLEELNLIEKVGQSSYRYKVREDIDKEQAVAEENALDDNYLPITYFVFASWFMQRRKRIGKKEYKVLEEVRNFSPTAILFLLLLIRHNNNPNKTSEYYIAGEEQIAKTLNKPQSMISDAANELIKAGFVHRNFIKVYYDAQGGVVGYGKPQSGKGVNKYCRTCYILDDKLRKIKLDEGKEKKVKALFTPKPVTTENDVIINDLMIYLHREHTITNKDRRMVVRWFEWGFDSEMIKAAAQFGKGKASDAVRYVNGILKNWYSEGIRTIDDVHKTQPKKKRSILEIWGETLQMNAEKETSSSSLKQRGQPPQAANNGNSDLRSEVERHYYDLQHIAESAAEKALRNATADSIYGGIRKRLNELSIQRAFAEIRDKAAAEKISEEIKELEERGDKRLAELGINKTDFEPHYSCTICNDTGYDKSDKPCKCMKEFIDNITGKRG